MNARFRRAIVAASLMGLCIFFASGRTTAFDARSQLTEAVHVCATGQIAARHPLTADFAPKNFKHVPHIGSHVWYDANDIGGTAVMLPAACLSTLLGAPNPHHSTSLTTVAKSGAQLTFALLGGIGVVFVFLTLAHFLGDRRAFWWTVGFLFTTAYLAYVKGIWNVVPAAAALAGLCYVVARQFQPGRIPRLFPGAEPAQRDEGDAEAVSDWVPPSARRLLCQASFAVAMASLCRYSMLPFLVAGTLFAMVPTLRRASRRDLLWAGLVLVVLVAPDFWYNQLRTGKLWVPGESAPQFIVVHITGSYLVNSPGMWFGIQRGLLFYAPVCLLGYFGAAWIGYKSKGLTRFAWWGVLATAVGYATAVIMLHNWYVYGWGPRYLVPIMPALFIAAVIAVEGGAVHRGFGYAATGLGVLTQLPVAFVNWQAVIAVVGVEPRASDGIVGLWHSFWRGLSTGQGFGDSKAHRSLQVPDTWWWHAVGENPPYGLGLAAAAGGLLLLLALGAWRARRPSPAPTPAPQPTAQTSQATA